MKSASRHPRSSGSLWLPALRVAFLLTVAASLVSVALLREVRAQVDEAMLGLGSQIMAFPGGPVDEARVVRLNGLTVSLRTQVVEAPLFEVLRHYQGVCASPLGGGLEDSSILSSLAKRSGQGRDDGYVACVEVAPSNLETLAHRLARFSRTWDLADVGAVRYAYARRAEQRPEQETFVVTMWTDTSASLRGLLPLGGSDAAGTDLVDVPRPDNGQRILSAREASEPTGVFVYLADGASPKDLVLFYRRVLPERGWSLIERSSGESIELDGIRMLSAEKRHRMVTVLAHPGEADRTVLTLLAWEVD